MMTIEPHIQGLIFDSDGTLVDTMPLHYLAWQAVLQGYDAQFPEDLFYELAGVPSEKITQILNDRFGYLLEPRTIARQKEDLFLEQYLPQARPIGPVIEIARRYKGRLPMAVATGGIPPVVQAALRAVGLEDFFEAIVTAEDVAHGKPAPDTFLEAARRMGVDPGGCIVFEDSDMGLEAARRAGMQGVDIRPWVER